MKRLFTNVAVLLVMLTTSQLSAETVVTSTFRDQSPRAWEICKAESDYIPKPELYVPNGGGIKIYKADGKKIVVGFCLSSINIEFYGQMFSDGKRKPLGFEIVINDLGGVFNRKNIVSIEESENFPSGARYDKSYVTDGKGLYLVGINDPTKFKVDVWYYVTFNFSGYTDAPEDKFEVDVQLVGDVRKFREEYSAAYHNGYSTDVITELYYWFEFDDNGRKNVDGANFFPLLTSYRTFQKEHFFQIPGTVPVYRFYNDATGEDFYTLDEGEKNVMMSNPNYVYKGIAYYAIPL